MKSTPDRVRLSGLSFYGYHGVSPAEKEVGRLFEVDCEMAVDLSRPSHSDKLTDTIDYTAVYQEIREAVEDQVFSLLEALAEHLAERLLARFPVEWVTLRVRKLTPPIPGQIRHVEVEITRSQKAHRPD